ncbi:hypothetical protein HRG_007700 [Hirsutella rhossiliensis]|uniref:Uncharacterized protein n=1 Tax=Hirsutella rhossiliensis TaxID=111463 RepID=A0A9P8MUH4_9HYPO|nr:uncharacterized protein HRG_07700 [Hirsutella rhossiliensis]KAH0961622.1 hypothetical protein HRG_07700 [Hirsutella rhossiliensis]
MPRAAHVFEPGLGASQSPLLESLIREHLERATHDLDMNTPPPSTLGSEDLLLNDMGDYLCRTATLWAYLTDRLLKGPHLEQAAFRAHERSRTGTGMSDLTEVARVDIDITRLRKIRDMTLEFSHKVQSTWRPRMINSPPGMQATSISPFCDAKLSIVSNKSMSVSSDGGERSLKARKLLPDSHVQLHPDVGHRSDESDESDDEMFLDIDMEALRQRGKGTYSCPKAYQCKKGGVDKEGNLVIFDRNSSFAQHCNKHRKPWRCDIPGCPNPPKKRRFARRDGLERHKATVKHYVVT